MARVRSREAVPWALVTVLVAVLAFLLILAPGTRDELATSVSQFLSTQAAAGSWIGLAVSIGGFYFTIRQLRQTATAAAAAAGATNKTIRAVRAQQRAVGVSRLEAIVRSVDEAVQANRSAPVPYLFNDWRAEAMRLVGLVQSDPDAENAQTLTDLIASLEIVATATAALLQNPDGLDQITTEARQVMKRSLIPIAVWAVSPVTDNTPEDN